MALATSAIALGIGAAGLFLQGRGALRSSDASQRISAAEIRAENARQRQMELDSKRKQRDIIRNAQVARATALSKTSDRGASEGSALPGTYGQIASEAGQQILATAENTQIGRELFAANRDKSAAQASLAQSQAEGAFGGAMVGAAGNLARIGSSLL